MDAVAVNLTWSGIRDPTVEALISVFGEFDALQHEAFGNYRRCLSVEEEL